MRMKDTIDAQASETISDLQCQVSQLTDELRAKDNLIASLRHDVAQWKDMRHAKMDGTPFLAMPWTRDINDASVTYWMADECRYANWPWSEFPVSFMPLPTPFTPEKG